MDNDLSQGRELIRQICYQCHTSRTTAQLPPLLTQVLMKILILNLVIAAIFLLSGGAKLAGLEFEIAAFERWGYPLWFMYLTGALEVLGGVGLWVKRVSALAAACLAALMIGAVATHVLHSEWGMLVAATVIMGLAATRAWLGRNAILALLSRG